MTPLNMPMPKHAHVYVTVWEDLHNTTQRPGDAVFRCESESTLGIQKRTQLEISGLVVFTTLFQNSSTQILECVQCILRLFPEPGRVTLAYNASCRQRLFL